MDGEAEPMGREWNLELSPQSSGMSLCCLRLLELKIANYVILVKLRFRNYPRFRNFDSETQIQKLERIPVIFIYRYDKYKYIYMYF